MVMGSDPQQDGNDIFEGNAIRRDYQIGSEEYHVLQKNRS